MSASAAAQAGHDLLPSWAFFAIYGTGFIITARVIFMTDDGDDRAEARLLSACVGLIWPLMIAFFAVWGLVLLPTLGAKTRTDRQMRARAAEQERRRLAAHIAELEGQNERLRREAA